MTPTPIRSVRISNELWKAVSTKAKENGISVSQVIVQALQEYAK